MADVVLLGMAASAQPRNRHRAKTDETSRDRVVIMLFSTLSSLQPARVTKRSLVLATPPSGRHRGGVLVTVGVCLQGAVAILPMVRRRFLR